MRSDGSNGAAGPDKHDWTRHLKLFAGTAVGSWLFAVAFVYLCEGSFRWVDRCAALGLVMAAIVVGSFAFSDAVHPVPK